MKAFTCPQCGASLEYERIVTVTVKCHYCNSVVVVPVDLRPPPPPTPPRPEREPLNSFGDSRPNKTVPALIVALVLIGGLSLLIVGLSRSSSNTNRSTGLFSTPTPRRTPTPVPTPDPGYTVAFTFGAEGTGPGFFKDEMDVAVDGEGRVYVSDDTRRVQRFDASGNFLGTWTIPSETKWYKRLRGGPDKLLAPRWGSQVYAVLAGVVAKFEGATGEVLGAAHGSDYVHDATLIPDGGLLMVTQKGDDDELVLMGGDGRVSRRTHRFVSSLLDKQLTVKALRVAADGTGNTFALYALGDVYGEHWYDDDDLAVFRFTPEGKYVSRFGSGGHEPGQFGVPSAIAVDNQSRIYVCEPFNKVHIYADDGRHLSTFEAPHMVKALTFDAANHLYIAGGHKVSKLVLTR
ncbi:MAG TPA: hypothetical protein VF240_14825 [Pyrinomonadaceae bacterium]